MDRGARPWIEAARPEQIEFTDRQQMDERG